METIMCGLATLSFETTELKRKAKELAEALKIEFPEGIPSHLFSELQSKGLDVVVGHDISASSAGGTKEILVHLDFASGFESLIAAIRAGEVDDFVHTQRPFAEEGLPHG
jgi:hypothetical protein